MINHDHKIDSILTNWVKDFPRSYFKKIKANVNKHILKYIEDNTPLLDSPEFLISTKVYWILNDITEFPKCSICGKEIRKNIKINEKYPTHCSAKCLSHDPNVQRHKEESYERRYGEGIINPFQSKEVIKKIDETNLKKYKVRRFTQTDEYRNVISKNRDDIESRKNKTHTLNNSFNDSKTEFIIFNLLKKSYPDTVRHFKSEEYPFTCDFYIPSKNTYIEYNGTWTHGGHPFNKYNSEDVSLCESWKNKHMKYYDNAVYVWTDLDVRRRDYAKKNNLNFVEFWNFKDVMNWLGIKERMSLLYPYNQKKLIREFEYYRTKSTDVMSPYVSRKNEIVKYFQQDAFFRKEKELWNTNDEKREKLIFNRVKYLNKEESELTVDDILTGFKKSGIHYGYSHFNPLWFKWFIGKYNVRTCYDPCGGWGHRLLGGLNLEKYIYNDFSPETKKNVDSIIRYFKIGNTTTYNNDARTFIPDENFEAMFTCPPYFNVEHYECGDFTDRREFDNFIDSLFNTFKIKPSCNVFGLVIREDLLGSHDDFMEKIPLNTKDESYMDNKQNNYNEFLYVFKKG